MNIITLDSSAGALLCIFSHPVAINVSPTRIKAANLRFMVFPSAVRQGFGRSIPHIDARTADGADCPLSARLVVTGHLSKSRRETLLCYFLSHKSANNFTVAGPFPCCGLLP